MKDKNATRAVKAAAPEATKHTVSSVALSVVVSLALVITGVAFTVTMAFSGVGLLVGIPFLIAGVAAPFILLRGMFRREKLAGACPHCGAHISLAAHLSEASCPVCGNHLVIKDEKFIKAE